MDNEEFKTKNLALFDECTNTASVLRLMFSFMINIAILLKQVRDILILVKDISLLNATNSKEKEP